jgi:hypothetical protein
MFENSEFKRIYIWEKERRKLETEETTGNKKIA